MKLAAVALAFLASLLLAAAPAAAQVPEQCRYLGAKDALLPFPNDAFTVADEDAATGRRLRIQTRCAPRNKDGKRIAMDEQNRLDGFSPGSQLIVRVPGVNTEAAFKRSKIAPITDIGASLKKNAPIVILDANTRKRVAYWAELDANATKPKDRLLLVHPAANLAWGRRYVVVMRNLRTASGKRVKPAKGMRAARGARLKSNLALARRAKISRKGIHLVWEFTVGSRRSVQTRLLTMRDDAFNQLGDRDTGDNRVEGNAPRFAVTGVEEFTPAQNSQLLRRVTGTFQVPCYLTSDGCAVGGTVNLGADGRPAQRAGNEQAANFVCLIPRAAEQAPSRASVYGHGLLGGAKEASGGTSIHLMAQEHNFTFCATDWSGMSEPDVPNIASNILTDLSNFPQLTDRLQQGILNFTYLGRLMRHPAGLITHPAFQVAGRAAFDPGALYYDGNSQGGIIGGALTAIAPDFRRAVLGVTGMNFSLLLTRSSNWKLYGGIFNPAYPREAERPLALSLIQLLWDRSESDGWAHNMTRNPPPKTPSHEVLMQVARGDHQVTTAAADIKARTLGARTMPRPLAPGVSDEKEPLWGIERIDSFPYAGSALVYWEPGGGLARVPEQPLTNTPEHPGVDPHGDPRYTAAARRQKAAFLSPEGTVIDVCNGGPCQAEKDPARP